MPPTLTFPASGNAQVGCGGNLWHMFLLGRAFFTLSLRHKLLRCSSDRLTTRECAKTQRYCCSDNYGLLAQRSCCAGATIIILASPLHPRSEVPSPPSLLTPITIRTSFPRVDRPPDLRPPHRDLHEGWEDPAPNRGIPPGGGDAATGGHPPFREAASRGDRPCR